MPRKRDLWFLFILIPGLCSPVPLKSLTYSAKDEGFIQSYPSLQTVQQTNTSADLNQDYQAETIQLINEQARIIKNGEIVWASPAPWQVKQVEITDLNWDEEKEVSLLVYRPYREWPVDRYLNGTSRTGSFHDADNNSCQIILIGWKKDHFDEIWAGSALAEPLQRFAEIDPERNGDEILVGLETTYDQHLTGSIDAISEWEWNGFGFSLVRRVRLQANTWVLGMDSSHQPVLLFSP